MGNSSNMGTPSVNSLDGQANFRDELMDKGSQIVLVTYARKRGHPQELSVIRGEYLEVCIYVR